MLLETIQILNGQPQRLGYHNERFNRSRNALFCLLEEAFLEDYIQIPIAYQKGKVKCRIEYDEHIRKVSFENYIESQISAFHLVESDLSYELKYADRAVFKQLKSSFPPSSEIIIMNKGIIKDSSYTNLVFKHKNGKWLTPITPLLKGTQSAYLLDEGIIEEAEIRSTDLKQFTEFMMINAMLDFDENRVYGIHLISDQK